MKNKICVYTICKNEIKFIDRWFNSVKEADYICVLDTGSTDGSFEKLQKLGIITKQIINKKAIQNTEIALNYKDSEHLRSNLKIYKRLLSSKL